jgi:hypothetical protein
MNSSDYISLFGIRVWCAVIFGQGFLVGIAWAESPPAKDRDDKRDNDDDTTPPHSPNA